MELELSIFWLQSQVFFCFARLLLLVTILTVAPSSLSSHIQSHHIRLAENQPLDKPTMREGQQLQFEAACGTNAGQVTQLLSAFPNLVICRLRYSSFINMSPKSYTNHVFQYICLTCCHSKAEPWKQCWVEKTSARRKSTLPTSAQSTAQIKALPESRTDAALPSSDLLHSQWDPLHSKAWHRAWSRSERIYRSHRHCTGRGPFHHSWWIWKTTVIGSGGSRGFVGRGDGPRHICTLQTIAGTLGGAAANRRGWLKQPGNKKGRPRTKPRDPSTTHHWMVSWLHMHAHAHTHPTLPLPSPFPSLNSALYKPIIL